FHFALPADRSELAAKGLLWVALIFTALLGLTRAFVAERDQGLLDGLLLAPCDRSAIWLAKGVAMLAFLAAAEVVALPAFSLFFSGIDGPTVAGVVLADIGIAAVGTLLAAMASVSRAREPLLPLLHLWKRAPGTDLESYVAIHQGVIFGALTLITGSIWAKISWGHWWLWGERQLVLFLVLFLFYSAYFMLRYSVEPGPARANLCAVYALFGVVLIPVSWLSIRIANDYIHPTVFTTNGPQMSGSMFLAFCVSWTGLLVLAGTMYRVELAGKRIDARLRELRELLA